MMKRDDDHDDDDVSKHGVLSLIARVSFVVF